MTTSSTPNGVAPRANRPKGPEPQFFDHPDTEKLLRLIVALTGEFSVLKERLDTHERLAAAGQVATPEAIEAYVAGPEVDQERAGWREAYLNRVFKAIEPDAQKDPATEIMADNMWEDVIEETGC